MGGEEGRGLGEKAGRAGAGPGQLPPPRGLISCCHLEAFALEKAWGQGAVGILGMETNQQRDLSAWQGLLV